jgi:uncharacterized protein (DUF2147 family)
MKKILSLPFFFLVTSAWLVTSIQAQHKSDDILGYWFNEEKTSKVQIFKDGNKYHAKIVWLKEPNDVTTGKPRVDNLNPEPKLQNVPLMGLVIMKDFTFNGADEWKNGSIYDPKKGKLYSCYIQFDKPNVLKIRGYIGVSLLGRTTYWTKTVFQQ